MGCKKGSKKYDMSYDRACFCAERAGKSIDDWIKEMTEIGIRVGKPFIPIQRMDPLQRIKNLVKKSRERTREKEEQLEYIKAMAVLLKECGYKIIPPGDTITVSILVNIA